MNVNYRKEINKMRPYIPGKPIEDAQKELGLDQVVKLASNENPLGCSPKAKEAITASFSEIALYPDGNTGKLRSALSKHLKVAEDQLIFGAGSDEIIGIIAKVFLNSNEDLLTSDQSFPRYDSAAQLMGGNIVKVPMTNYTYDLARMKEYVNEKTKIVILANPNNPTGTYFTNDSLADFLEFLPDHVMVVLDEAYYEYVSADDYPKSLGLLEKHSNLIILRTFSKAYGLASLRVGYGISCIKDKSLLDEFHDEANRWFSEIGRAHV